MNSEYFAVILWENARKQQSEIIEDIEKKFQINKIYEISWPKNSFKNNLKRFYGITLVDPTEKEKQCGNGSFLLIILEDKVPKHGKRKTSLGSQIVNINIYDNKMEYRKRLGSGYIIHSSIHEKESKHDFMLLLGKTMEEIRSQFNNKWEGTIEKINQDLFGNTWNSPEDVFKVLNSTVNYVVLRNFEIIPYNLTSKKHTDVDLLTDDQWQIPYILNMKKMDDANIGFFPFVKIKDKEIKFDIKYVGDAYYDEKWSRDILQKRKLTENNIYVPNNEDYFFSLLYHMIIHKKQLKEEYCKRIYSIAPNYILKQYEKKDFKNIELSKKILKDFLDKNNYKFTQSVNYKISHNEAIRLLKVMKFTLKHEGVYFLLRAIKSKIRRKFM